MRKTCLRQYATQSVDYTRNICISHNILNYSNYASSDFLRKVSTCYITVPLLLSGTKSYGLNIKARKI